jgi:hypothetical protein
MASRWSRGFNRLFLVLTACWLVFIFVVMPIVERREFIEIYSQRLADCQHEKYLSHEDSQTCADQYKSNVNGIGYSWSLEKGGWHEVLGAAVVPPAILYCLVYALALIAAWVWRGFAR